MTNEETPQPVVPSKKDRMRPAELLGFSAVLATFTFLVVLLTTRGWKLALVSFAIVFIVSLVVVALVGLGMTPNAEDIEARKRIEPEGSEGDEPL